jgi:hypothetical protein
MRRRPFPERSRAPIAREARAERRLLLEAVH